MVKNIEEAAAYWQGRLEQGKPINKIKVRRILALAGSERRGYVIVKKIRDVLDAQGLVTVPDFELAWIDGPVQVQLASASEQSESREQDPYAGSEPEATADEEELDPAFSDQDQSPSGTEPVAEPLNASPEVGQPEGGPANAKTSTDPVIRVASLAAANRGVVSVSVCDTVEKATTLMLFNNYSQLAVMQGEREAKGMISWESIARRSMHSPAPATVQDCMSEAKVVSADSSLVDTLRDVEKYGYVLVRDKGSIKGIVTATDFATELASMSQAFMSIGTIERLIRNRLHSCLLESDFEYLEKHSRASQERNFSLLTFGENVRLMDRPEVWGKLELAVDKFEFTKRLKRITDIRNEVMHFGPDPLSALQKNDLEQMESFLRHAFV